MTEKVFTPSSAKEHLENHWHDVNSEILYLPPSKLKKYYKVLSIDEIKKILQKHESYSLMKRSHNNKKYNPMISFHVRGN